VARAAPALPARLHPSRGEELQSEYLLPRPVALEAIAYLRELLPQFAGILQTAEIRTFFCASARSLAPAYPRFADFLALRDRVDPERKFGNNFLQRTLDPHWPGR